MKLHILHPALWMLALAFLTGGCEDEVPQGMYICRTEWILKSLGPVGAETPIVAESRVELRFACDDTFSGNSGCNSYSGQFSATDAGDITIGQTAMSEMACLDAALMDQEARYIGALTRVTRFEREEDTLRLYYDGGTQNLYFEECTDCD